jgi:tetratricopeptide (TPR) repeat protein
MSKPFWVYVCAGWLLALAGVRSVCAQPDSVYALNQEAVTLSQQGRYAEAWEKIQQAFALDSTHEVIRGNLAQIGRALAGELTKAGQWKKGVDLLESLRERVSEKEPEILRQLVITQNNWGVALSEKDDYIGADQTLSRATQLAYRLGDDGLSRQIGGVYSRMLTAWGDQWLASGKGETAKIKLLEAIRYDDRNDVAYQLLGKVYFDDGDYRQAEYYLQQALRLKPADTQIAQLLAQVQNESKLDGDLRSRSRGKFRVEFSGSEELELAGDVFDILEDARKELGRLFDFYPDESILVKIYNSEHSNALGIAPHWASGLYDGKIRVMAADIRRGGGELEDILYHEYAHAILYYLTRHNIPTWLNEGLAQYCEPNSEPSSREERQVREWIERRQYIPMTRLENSFLDFSSQRAQQAYQESRLFARFLVDRFGQYALRDLLRKLGRGLNMEQAAQSVYGDSVSGLEQQWIREMR